MIEEVFPEVESANVESLGTEMPPDSRYPLFDSGCATSVDVARSVE